MKKIFFFLLILILGIQQITAQEFTQLYKEAENLRKDGKITQAKEIFNRLSFMRQNAKDYLGLGKCYLALHQADSALDVLNKAILLDPNNSEIYYNLGLTYLTGFGESQKALANFKQAYKLAPDSINYALYIGLAYQAKGSLDSAYNFYKIVMQKDTTNPYPYYFLADYLFEIDSLSEAYDFVNKAINKDTKNYNFYYLKASIEYKARLYDLALKTINKALEIYPNSTKLLIFKSQVLFQLQKYGQVIELLEPIIKTQVNNLNPYYYLAWSYYYVAEYDKAIKLCQQAIKLNNNLSEFYQILAYTYIAKGDYDKAQKAIDKLLSLAPENIIAYNLKITASLYARTKTGVLGSDKKFIKINALNLDYIHNALRDQTNTYYYQRLWNKFHNNPERLSLDEYAMLYLGYKLYNDIERMEPATYMTFYSQGKYNECISQAQRAIAQYPLDQNAYFYIALSYHQLTKPKLFIKNLSIYHGLQKAILSTGDGMSEQTAYLITNNDDIYYILNYTIGNPRNALTFGLSNKTQENKQFTIVRIGFRPKVENTLYFLLFN